MKTYKGIDVSLYQGDIDWSKVKRCGTEFAMIKASQGRMSTYDAPFTDPKFRKNIEGAAAAGLYVGCYHYLCCRNEGEARAEAEYFVNQLKPYREKIKLWAAVDIEDGGTVGKLSRGELDSCVRIFTDTVKAAGFRPMVYGSTWWVNNKFTTPPYVPIWEANLSIAARPWRSKIWQKSFTGRVDGIAGDVDLNEAVDIIGDADGDGLVTVKDVQLMLKRIAGWKGTALDVGQADTDGDGRITVKDVFAVMKVIAGK